jgi:hypothetical protein
LNRWQAALDLEGKTYIVGFAAGRDKNLAWVDRVIPVFELVTD